MKVQFAFFFYNHCHSHLTFGGRLWRCGFGISENLASYGSSDVWLLKLNSDFSLAWQIVLGGNDAESNPVVLATNDGGYLVGVSSVSPISGNKSVASFGLSDVWLIKIDGNGVMAWWTLEEH
ncbi:MAG: hypothetical protein IPG07_04255 [Crocinitomicaceae bacterium]|nr:hypothetical protein [Crocinitomicaceae bacterium]